MSEAPTCCMTSLGVKKKKKRKVEKIIPNKLILKGIWNSVYKNQITQVLIQQIHFSKEFLL